MYRQIAEDLQRRIASGELVPGAQLPAEIDLREQYNASRNTVRDAIRWLMTRGLVETRPGQGTFVVEKINPFVTTLTGKPFAGKPRRGDQRGSPFRLTVTVYPADRNLLRFNVGQVPLNQ